MRGLKKVSQYHQGEWAFCVIGGDYQSHALPLLKHHLGQFNQKVCSNIQLIIVFRHHNNYYVSYN